MKNMPMKDFPFQKTHIVKQTHTKTIKTNPKTNTQSQIHTRTNTNNMDTEDRNKSHTITANRRKTIDVSKPEAKHNNNKNRHELENKEQKHHQKQMQTAPLKKETWTPLPPKRILTNSKPNTNINKCRRNRNQKRKPTAGK